MLAGLDPNSTDYKRLKAQMLMENHMELMEFISNITKMMHDTAMAITANFR